MTWLKQPQFFTLLTGTAILLNGCAANPEAREADKNRVTPIATGPAPLERVVPRQVTDYSKPEPRDGGKTGVRPVATAPAPAERAAPRETTGPSNEQPTEAAQVPPVVVAESEPAAPVKSTPPVRATPKPVAPRSIKETRYVDATSLNVRSNSNANASIKDRLPRNATVTVTSERTGGDGQRWSQIGYNDNGNYITGWVATEYLSTTASSTPARAANASQPAGLIRTTFKKPSGEYFEQFERLNYTPVPKPSYPGNPKIQAKGVYVSFNVLSSDRFDTIINLVETTELNALVIDFKDDVGGLLTRSPTAARLVPQANALAKYEDISGLIQKLKAKKIYLIARIVTFKDPLYVKAHPETAIVERGSGKPFKSGDGLAWASPYDSGFRAYNIALAKEAAAAGFNEIQFDYVRFPDVPRAANLNYRNTNNSIKAEAIQDFLLEARAALAPEHVYIAADVFGMVTTTVDDMRIGQYWEAVSNAVDYICPMMYPSHYANTVYQLPVPDARPYDLIYRGLDDALARDRALKPPAHIRPWLQGFTATWVKGYINYGASEVKAQIRAAAEQGVDSYLIWHPSGLYNPAAYR